MNKTLLMAIVLALPLAANAADKPAAKTNARPAAPAAAASAPAAPAAPAAIATPTDARAALKASKARGADMGACRQKAADQGLAGLAAKQFIVACLKTG